MTLWVDALLDSLGMRILLRSGTVLAAIRSVMYYLCTVCLHKLSRSAACMTEFRWWTLHAHLVDAICGDDLHAACGIIARGASSLEAFLS